jgi:hypothetical protein
MPEAKRTISHAHAFLLPLGLSENMNLSAYRSPRSTLNKCRISTQARTIARIHIDRAQFLFHGGATGAEQRQRLPPAQEK